MVWLTSRILLILGLVAVLAAVAVDPPTAGPVLLRLGMGLALIGAGLVCGRSAR